MIGRPAPATRQPAQAPTIAELRAEYEAQPLEAGDLDRVRVALMNLWRKAKP